MTFDIENALAEIRFAVAELNRERDETSVGSLAETAKVWHNRCLEAEREIDRIRTFLSGCLSLSSNQALSMSTMDMVTMLDHAPAEARSPYETLNGEFGGLLEDREAARAEVVRLGQEVDRLTEEAVEAGRAELGADIEAQEAKDRTRELAVQLNRHRVLLGELWLSVGAEWRHLTEGLPVVFRELWADAAEDWCGSVRYPEKPDRWWRTEEQPERDDTGTLAALARRNAGLGAVLRVAVDTESTSEGGGSDG